MTSDTSMRGVAPVYSGSSDAMKRHPLDRPIWSALTTRQQRLALGDDLARRFDHGIAPFAAIAEDDDVHVARLGSLIARHGRVVMLQCGDIPVPPGAVVQVSAGGVQLVLDPLGTVPARAEIVPLGAADAIEMGALARLTKPGPFEARTWELGGFLGVRVHNRLVGMAGERMKPEGFTELSGVCTHPEHRGKVMSRRAAAASTTGITDAGRAAFRQNVASWVATRTIIDSLLGSQTAPTNTKGSLR